MAQLLYADALVEKVLVEPAERGSTTLSLLSATATPAMAFHLQSLLKEMGLPVSIDLTIGMTPLEGIRKTAHLAFKQLMERELKGIFTCSYATKMPPVHANVFLWSKGGTPSEAFLGSAQFTQASFRGAQREALSNCDPAEAAAFISQAQDGAVYCTHSDAETSVVLYDDRAFEYKATMGRITQEIVAGLSHQRRAIEGLPRATLSFLDKGGDLPQRSGLNWGQRPEQRRAPNQAYIPVRADVAALDFFPPRGEHFTVLTDDDKVLICTRAQDNGKAIETPHNNSLIGEYFRNRLGVGNGEPVTKDALLEYGRSEVDFFRIDPETYFLDFSQPE